MAISITWATKVINVPKADTQFVSSGPAGEIRQLNLDTFRLALKDLEADEEGIPFIRTHNHNSPVTVGGVTLARVIEIINGYTVTFEDGQYAVNLVGANSNVGDVTNVNQVSIRSANSVGLAFSDEINAQSFTDNSIYIDTVNGLPGVLYPRGTPRDPVDNFADAETIRSNENLRIFTLISSLTMGVAESLAAKTVSGEQSELSQIVLAGGSTALTTFRDLTISGTVNGLIYASRCFIAGITDFQGALHESSFAGNVTVDPACTTLVSIIECVSDVPGTSKPVLDCNSAACDFSIRDWSGGLEVRNFNQGGQSMSIDLNSGSVRLASTCTSGTIVVRGVGELIDETGAGCTVVRSGLLNGPDAILMLKLLQNRQITDPTTGRMTVYDDDGTTALLAADLFEDVAGAQPYRGQGADRRERLE